MAFNLLREAFSSDILKRGSRLTLYTFQGLCAYSLFANNVASFHWTSGASMYPRYRPTGEAVIAEHISYRWNPASITRGDFVAIRKPTDKYIVSKRVIGLPGDTICVDPAGPEPWKHIIVPEGHIWLAGDNLANSQDSRHYGPVPMGLIVGKVVLKLTPFPSTNINPLTYIQ